MNRGEHRIYAAAVLAAVLLVGVFALADTQRTETVESTRYTRACIPGTGAPAAVACTNLASASSAQLTAWTRYIVSCPGDDAYLAFGTTAPTATSSYTLLPKKSWFEFLTNDTTRYMACLGASTTPSCVLLECK